MTRRAAAVVAVLVAIAPFTAIGGVLDTSPPTVGAVRAISLDGPFSVTFNEPVWNITPQNVVLQESGNTFPFSQNCADARGSATPCAVGDVRTVSLTPHAPLAAGQRYTVEIDPAGALPIVDHMLNPAPPSTRAFVARDLTAFAGLATWVDLFDQRLDASRSIPQMQRHGVRAVYIETARFSDRRDIAFRRIGEWIERAHAAGLKVVGWYLPAYSEYLRTDIRRTVAIARYRTQHGQRFDALAVDIEFRGKASSVREWNDGIARHLAAVRNAVGPGYTIGAITPPPKAMELAPRRWRGFPWGSITRYANVVVPMDYWSFRWDCSTRADHCADGYSRGNIDETRKATALPIHLAGGVGDSVSTEQVRDFVRAASTGHVLGGSLYDFRTTTAAYWRALEDLNRL
jgi:Big-like domain-containing protein